MVHGPRRRGAPKHALALVPVEAGGARGRSGGGAGRARELRGRGKQAAVWEEVSVGLSGGDGGGGPFQKEVGVGDNRWGLETESREDESRNRQDGWGQK